MGQNGHTVTGSPTLRKFVPNVKHAIYTKYTYKLMVYTNILSKKHM